MTKQQDDWLKQPRISRLSQVLWPSHTSKETQKVMAELAANEGKSIKGAVQIPHHVRKEVSPLGGTAVKGRR
jgi:hypothetical protein